MRISGVSRDVGRSIGGVWWSYTRQSRVDAPVAGEFCVCLAEKDNPRHRAALAELAIARQPDIRAGGEAGERAAREVRARALARGVVTGWSGAIDSATGAEIPYSEDACVEALLEPANFPLLHFVLDVSDLSVTYRQAEEARAVGN